MQIRRDILDEDLEFIKSASLDWNRLRGKTILVVGANGILPSYMVETLLSLNETHIDGSAKIIGGVRNLPKAQQRFKAYLTRPDFSLQVLDLSEPITLDVKVHFIVHAASQASPKYYGKDPVGTLLPNTIGTYHLLQLAIKNPIEGFLFFSSGEVYGEVEPDRIPTKEEDYGYVDPIRVRSCYGESKRMGENMCVSYHHQHGIPTKIVRPFHTYGPGMLLDDGRVFADFVSNIVHNEDILMKSDGKSIRPFCYLADATRGFFTVLLEGTDGQAYNIGNPYAEISIKDLAHVLAGLFPEKNLKVIELGTNADRNYIESTLKRNCPDISKIVRLGWTPKFSVFEGFKRTILSYY